MRKRLCLPLLSLCILLLNLITGAGGAWSETAISPQAKVGIIAAMDQEVENLIQAVQEPKIKEIAGIKYYEGSIGSHKVIISKCGVGKVSAALGAQIMIDAFAPDYIINTGCAGALQPGISIGDIVLSTSTVEWDLDCTVFGDPRGQVSALGRVAMNACTPLRQALAAAIPSNVKVHHGMIASGDTFISQAEQRDFILECFPRACCVEMEGGAIGHVCAQNRVPFCILRCMSDTAESHVIYEEFSPKACRLAADIVIRMLNAQPALHPQP